MPHARPHDLSSRPSALAREPGPMSPCVTCVSTPGCVGPGSARSTREPSGMTTTSAADQRAAALFQRAERLVGRNGGAQVVEVAGVLRLGRLLHLVEIGVVDLAA